MINRNYSEILRLKEKIVQIHIPVDVVWVNAFSK
jgi:hypothetical protein